MLISINGLLKLIRDIEAAKRLYQNIPVENAFKPEYLDGIKRFDTCLAHLEHLKQTQEVRIDKNIFTDNNIERLGKTKFILQWILQGT